MVARAADTSGFPAMLGYAMWPLTFSWALPVLSWSRRPTRTVSASAGAAPDYPSVVQQPLDLHVGDLEVPRDR